MIPEKHAVLEEEVALAGGWTFLWELCASEEVASCSLKLRLSL